MGGEDEAQSVRREILAILAEAVSGDGGERGARLLAAKAGEHAVQEDDR